MKIDAKRLRNGKDGNPMRREENAPPWQMGEGGKPDQTGKIK